MNVFVLIAFPRQFHDEGGRKRFPELSSSNRPQGKWLIKLLSIINFAPQLSQQTVTSVMFIFYVCHLVKGEQPEAMHAGSGVGLKSSTNVVYSLSLILLLSQVISQR